MSVRARHDFPSDHVPEVPVPFVHRGAGAEIYATREGFVMESDRNPSREWLRFDGPIGEVRP